jgi:predicted KAP-like P-loop ATPase
MDFKPLKIEKGMIENGNIIILCKYRYKKCKYLGIDLFIIKTVRVLTLSAISRKERKICLLLQHGLTTV